MMNSNAMSERLLNQTIKIQLQVYGHIQANNGQKRPSLFWVNLSHKSVIWRILRREKSIIMRPALFFKHFSKLCSIHVIAKSFLKYHYYHSTWAIGSLLICVTELEWVKSIASSSSTHSLITEYKCIKPLSICDFMLMLILSSRKFMFSFISAFV